MLPEGWQRVELRECVSKIGSGITPRGGSAVYKTFGYPLIRSQNVGWGSLLMGNVCYIDAHQHDAMSNTKLLSGDVLLNITGASIGRVASYFGEDCAANVNQHVCIIRSDGSLDAQFLAAFLLSEFGQTQVEQFQAGGNRQGLNFEQVGSFTLPFPPLPEQRRIAAVLDAWDTAIATAERLVAAQLQLRIGIEDSVLGQGESTRFADAADVWFSGVDKKIVEGEQAVRLCNYMDVLRNRRLTDDIEFSIGSATSSEVHRFALQKGDIVFTKDSETAAEIAEPSYVAEALTNVVCGYHLGIARPKEGISGAYLTHAIRSQKIRQQFVRRANGAIRFGLTLEAMDQIELPLPGLNRQVSIAGVLDAVDDEIARLGAFTAALRHQKRGLMQQLLTGKLRVPESIERLMPGGGGGV